MEVKKEDFETKDGFLEYLTGFVKGFMQRLPDLEKDKTDIPPTMFIVKEEKDKSNIYAVLLDGRDEIKEAVDTVSAMKPKLVGLILEGYMNEFDAKTGEFVGRKEAILIHVYSKEGKIMRMIEKFDLSNMSDSEDFEGYLTINDIDRVFGFDR